MPTGTEAVSYSAPLRFGIDLAALITSTEPRSELPLRRFSADDLCGHASLCVGRQLYAPRETHYFRQCRVSPGPSRGEAEAGSGTGGHIGGEDVVGVAVKVLAGPVVAHRGTRIGVARGDLDVSQVDASVEHGGDPRYLYLIFKKARSRAISLSEARRPRKGKERSEEKRPWSWPCRT